MPSRIVNMLRERVHNALATDREWSVGDDALCLHSPATHPPRRIEIQFRSDGDVDVAFFLEQVRGSPFEQHLLVAGEPIEEAALGIATFANDIVAERLVLVWKGFPAGRRFVPPADALDARWVASWLGTYDRDLPLPR